MDAQRMPPDVVRPLARRGPGGAPLWLWWAVLALVLVAVGVLVRQVLMDDATPGAAATTTDPTEETTATTPPATESTPPATEAPDAAMPLTMPGDHLPGGGVSEIPTTDVLPDGDYFVHLAGIDADARTVTVDVQVFYTGDAATEYLLATDPAAEVPPPNGYVIANDSPKERTLPLAADVRVWDWCNEAAGTLGFAERTVAEWAAAPAGGELACDAGPALSHGWNEVYWVQVRGGEVGHVIGQYLP